MKKAQVLRLITRLNIGGPAIQALMLTKALRNAYPTLLGAGRVGVDEGEMVDPEVDVFPLPLRRRISPLNDLRSVMACRRIINGSGCRLIHTHMAKAGFVGRLAAFTSHQPVRTIHTFHGHVLDGYFSPPIEKAFVAIERSLAEKTDVLVAVSPEVRDDLLALGIGTPEQWRVIPLGFHLEQFLEVDQPRGKLRQEIGLTLDVPIVGAVGRFAPIKDHRLLLDAIALVPDAHLVLVGDGEMRKLLQERARNKDLDGRVHFLGWRRDIADLLSDFDLVALTSLNEGTPVSLIEALAAGRPVVAASVGGVPSVVDEGETGWLVDDRQPALFAEKINHLLNEPEVRSRFGKRGRTLMIQRFSAERLVREISSLYDQLLH